MKISISENQEVKALVEQWLVKQNFIVFYFLPFCNEISAGFFSRETFFKH